jgi:hypothetical protein
MTNRLQEAVECHNVWRRSAKRSSRLPGEYSDVEIFRETAGQIILRARGLGAGRRLGTDRRRVMLMVTVTELRSWK